MTDERLTIFERHRPRLFGIAYRMLGAVEDAEDVVQETYLRWHAAGAEEIRSAEAWLVSAATRIAIDRGRRAATERSAYAGHWLPEPMATPEMFVTERYAERESDLSLAFVLLLERLAPEERAAFLLREVLGTSYADIARVLERTEPAVRQMVHRARERVRQEDRRMRSVEPDVKERLVSSFVSALRAEDEDALLAIFADDVTWTSDGGGKAPALRDVLAGAERVAKLAVQYQRLARGRITHEIARINGEPAVLTLLGDRTVFTTSFAIADGRITAMYRVLNPDKLHRVGPPPIEDWKAVQKSI